MAAMLDVLLVEDNLADARLVREFLRDAPSPGVKVTHAERLSDAVEFLRHAGFAAVLLDLNLADSQGLHTFEAARAEAKDTPIVVLSGFDDQDFAAEAVREGAQDYLVKGQVDSALLCRALTYAITRMKDQASLKDSQARLQLIADNVLDLVSQVTLDGAFVYASPSHQAILGHAPAELIDTSVFALVHPDDLEVVRAIFTAAIDHGTPGRTEIRCRHADGHYLWLEVIGKALIGDAGARSGAVLSGRDVTARRLTEDRLRESAEVEERMRFALRASGVGTWDLVLATGVLRCSELFEAQLGLKPGTFPGTIDALIDCMHPDDRDVMRATIDSALVSGNEFSVEHRTMWPDGTIKWLQGTGRVYHDDNGKPTRGAGISLDVTERHNLEAQYRQAQKMEAIGHLAGGVAHDFNNLLTVILGYCEFLQADFAAGERHRADIDRIQEAGMRAAGLTRQLLAFSRKQIIEPTLLDLFEVVTRMRPMLEPLIGEDITVVVAAEPGQPSLLKADRGQLEQIVMNLAVNARDAMPGGGTLTLATANVELDETYAAMHVGVSPGHYVSLTVTDTGAGISPQVQAHLFEPFFTTKAVGKGTGLGLATVHGIVKQFGGSITVDSTVGVGTSFHLYFPSAKDDGAVIAPAVVIAPRPAAAETILVVEDADGLRELTKRMLERQGYTVLMAANAGEALQMFERHPSIDLLLTDVVMPGASGPELTRRLQVQRPELKTIYMSGYTADTIAQQGVLKPGIVLVHKPFTSVTLGRKIREVLDQPAHAA